MFWPRYGQTHCHSPLDWEAVSSLGIQRISKMQDGVHHGFEPEFCIRRRTPRNIFKSRQRQRSQAGLHRILVSAAKQSRANTLSLPIAMNRKLPNVKLMIQNFGIQKSDQVVLRLTCPQI
ncbi:hypothetical protein AAV32_01905 [Kerstersia gyiorum]|uniref:Uncharacterized protein n=1 Tax=Kerstersia gyiorum TaxID=206506 RepID=A0A171KW17_9BURK|nr:hypothetical protein AAV32_01905 [Kerstersia gyiorum]